MLFFFENLQAFGGMSCSMIHLPHEATFVAYTKFFKTHKFKNSMTAEGAMLEHLTQFLGSTDIAKCMVCYAHGTNTVSKESWYKPENQNHYFKLLYDKIKNHLDLI